MSDLCMYELENNIWDEFGESDDLVVPQSADRYGHQLEVLANSRKKPRHEVIGIEFNNDKSHVSVTGKNSMLEKRPWSRTTNSGSPTSYDVGLIKEVKNNISSENSRMSNDGFNSGHIDPVDSDFCSGDPMLGDSSAAADNSLYDYSLNDIPQTENDLSFFNSGCDDKESSDLFFGWTDIGNFDDVDKMFRSCDSTFGLGSLSNEDSLWFSPPPTVELEVALTSDPKPNKVSKNHEAAMPKDEAPLTNDSNGKDVIMHESQSTDVSNAALGHISTAEVSDMKPQQKDDLMPSKQANPTKKQAKHLHQPEVKRNRYMANDVSFHDNDNFERTVDTKHQYGNSTCQLYPSSAFKQACVPNTHLNYDQASDQMSVCHTSSGIKCENNVNPSISSNESSYASQQAQSLESIHVPVEAAPGTVAFDKREKPKQNQDLRPPFATNIKVGKKPNITSFSGSVQKNESQSEAKGAADNPAELDSSNVQGSSCVSSVLDDVSQEATTFRQLQQVIEKLDMRTKLCIRDSLYRLAKSAEQRHYGMNPNGAAEDGKDNGSQSETNKYAGFMDMETDTNPIDRSIAHLLFHRPSDSSLMPQTDVLSYKSNSMIPRPDASPTLTVEKQEETPIAGTEKKVSSK